MLPIRTAARQTDARCALSTAEEPGGAAPGTAATPTFSPNRASIPDGAVAATDEGSDRVRGTHGRADARKKRKMP